MSVTVTDLYFLSLSISVLLRFVEEVKRPSEPFFSTGVFIEHTIISPHNDEGVWSDGYHRLQAVGYI